MNDPEVAMLDALTTTDLVAHSKALEAAGTAIRLVMRVPAPSQVDCRSGDPLRELRARQPRRRAGPVRTGPAALLADRLRFGQGGGQPPPPAVHAGVVDERCTATVLATFDEVRAMTWRLLNPRK
jgi:hypothetical protein